MSTQQNSLPRRAFLRDSAVAAGFLGLSNYLRGSEANSASGAISDRVIAPYGPLVQDPKGLLDLPEGFQYRIIAEQGRTMSDGFRTPGRPDDMATFPGPDGRVILVCNHELDVNQVTYSPFPGKEYPADLDRGLSYDAGTPGNPSDTDATAHQPYLGGTSTLVYNPATGTTEKHFLSLTGTDRNCSGGATPWGSWITCEEPEQLTSERGRRHGYCFEVSADPDSGLQKAVALKGLGRCRHEAVSYDPNDHSLYLTEDRNDGLLYRFVPEKERDFTKGQLYALALKDRASADLRNYDPKQEQVAENKVIEVEWIEIEDPDPPKDDLRITGHEAGAARFARGEGIFLSDGAHYICCTDGGPKRQGQIYRLLPDHFGKGRPGLELFLQPAESDLLSNGDNICAAPNGDLIICEDLVGDHKKRKSPHLRGVTPEGQIYNLARNAKDKTEFAGSCFSPDGSILFVNVQMHGLTVAITGPWRA